MKLCGLHLTGDLRRLWARAAAGTRRRAGDEAGIALVVALLAMFVISLMAAAAVAATLATSGDARRDVYRKNALEAAEAALQVALYRINMLQPTASNCVGDAVSAPASDGWCQSSSYTLGNGSSYQYYTTPALSSGACVGQSVVNTTEPVTQRCITAVGTDNGLVARSQIRVAAFTAAPLFPYGGITGLQSVTLNGNVSVGGSVASNVQIYANGNVSTGPIVLGPGGKFSHSGNVTYGATENVPTIVLDAVNPGTSNQASLSSCPARQTAGYPSCNDDYRITNGLASPRISPYDQSSGGVSFNSSTRSLTMSGNSSLTLGGGLYNFCNFTQSGNATINIAAGAHVEVIIDSPDDPGSGCPSGSGNLTMSGNVTWNNPNKDPTTLQLYVYGYNNNQNNVSLSGNSGVFYGVLYAPHSNVTLNGNAALTGAIAAWQVTLNGNAFNWDSRAGTLTASTNGLYYRTAWAQCSPTYSAAAPGAGCG